MLLLIKNLHEKNIIEKGKTKETLTARVLIMICTRVTTLNSCYSFTLVLQLYNRVTILHLCYNFTLVLQLYTCVTTLHSCYMKNALVFSQGRNFIHVKEKDYAKKTSACPRN